MFAICLPRHPVGLTDGAFIIKVVKEDQDWVYEMPDHKQYLMRHKKERVMPGRWGTREEAVSALKAERDALVDVDQGLAAARDALVDVDQGLAAERSELDRRARELAVKRGERRRRFVEMLT